MGEAEDQLLEHRRELFAAIQEELYPALSDFMSRLGLQDAPLVVRYAEQFLPAVDRWLGQQEVSPESFEWIRARVAYFLGELLVQRWKGFWFVDERPESPFFARIVVGGFERSANPGAEVDVFIAAGNYVSLPPGRSLIGALAEIEAELSVR